MNTIKAFVKTYLVSMLFALLYLAIIQNCFQKSEVWMIMIILFFANLLACFAYFMGVLWPFYYLLRPSLSLLTLHEAVQKYLIYFAIIPFILCVILIILGIESKLSAMQFSMLVIDASTVIYLGFIFSLKNNTKR
jgi:hypothetical protein